MRILKSNITKINLISIYYSEISYIHFLGSDHN